jgi:dolichol-phosphate mannosyltransferase
MASLAVVIPMFDEEAGAAGCVLAVVAVLRTLPGKTRLIAVDDGSTDMTPQLLDDLASHQELMHVVHRSKNGGYGAALRTGAEAAQRFGLDWVIFMDSDLTNPPADILRFAALSDGPVDYIKASRYVAGGRMIGVPWRRRLLSVVANRVSRAAAGKWITDPTNGFRAVRTNAFLEMPLREGGFAIIMEELYWAIRDGLRFAEVPSTLRSRSEGLRPSSFQYKPSVIWAYGRHTLRIAYLRLSRRRLAISRQPSRGDH